MTKLEPKHPAPGAATESDTDSGLVRIIELSAKWQEPTRWTAVLQAAKVFRECRGEIFMWYEIISDFERRECALKSIARSKFLTGDDPSQELNELAGIRESKEEHFEGTRDRTLKCKSRSDECYKQVVDAQEELIELKYLLRQHAPQLLEYVPDVDFGVHSENEWDFLIVLPEVDHTVLRRDMRKLEGETRVLSQLRDEAAGREAGVARRGVSLLDAALIVNEGDSDAARETKKRWQNSTDPKLPERIGTAKAHKATYLYELRALLQFIAIVEYPKMAENCRIPLKGKLQPLQVKTDESM